MKKKYIYIIIAVIIVFIMLGIVYVLFGNSNLQNNSVESKIENKMEEFLDLSYKYYLISEGPLEVGEGTINVDDKVYYYVTNKNFTKLTDIETLIKSLFPSSYQMTYIEKIYKNLEFIESEAGLYVHFINEPCKINYSLDNEDYELTKHDENSYNINFSSVGVYTYYEDDDWYLNSPLYFCSVFES